MKEKLEISLQAGIKKCALLFYQEEKSAFCVCVCYWRRIAVFNYFATKWDGFSLERPFS